MKGGKSNENGNNQPGNRPGPITRSQTQSKRDLGASTSSKVLHEQVQQTSTSSPQSSPVAAVAAGTQDHGMSPKDKAKVKRSRKKDEQTLHDIVIHVVEDEEDYAGEEEKDVEVQEGQTGEEDPELVTLRGKVAYYEEELGKATDHIDQQIYRYALESAIKVLAAFMARPADVMGALSSPMPRIKFIRQCTETPAIPSSNGSKLQSISPCFPYEPRKVYQISEKSMISIRDREAAAIQEEKERRRGSAKIVPREETERMLQKDVEVEMQFNSVKPGKCIEFSEIPKACQFASKVGVKGRLHEDLARIVSYASSWGILSVEHAVLSCSAYDTVGRYDLTIRRQNKDSDTMEMDSDTMEPAVLVEAETPVFTLSEIVKEWSCPYECDGCDGKRHQEKSLTLLLYNYLVVNGKRVGLLTTQNQWMGFFRDCSGNLMLTPIIECDTVGTEKKLSVAQLIVILCRIAYSTEKSSRVLPAEQLVACDGELCGGHSKLPDNCKNHSLRGGGDNQATGGGEDGSVASPSGNLSAAYSMPHVSDLIGIPSERNFVDFSIWKGHLNNQDVIVKLLDLSKQPEKNDVNTLDSMQNEAKIYNRLSELQSRCIPRLLGHGQTQEGFLYALAIEPVGEPISLKHVAKLETYRERATKVLQQVHKLGVLHGDIRAPNLLIHPDGERVFFIDFGMSEVFEPSEVDDDPTNRWTMRMLQEQHELNEIFDSLQKQSKCCEYQARMCEEVELFT